ncbi:MAG: O-antigen ligase [Gammaproteobacteria bacterium]
MTTLQVKIIYAVLGSLIITLFFSPFIIIFFIIICFYIFWQNKINLKHFTYLNNNLILAWFVFSAWATISYFWSISSGDTFESILKTWAIYIIAFTATASLLSIHAKKQDTLNVRYVYFSLMIINIVLIFEHLSGYQITLFLRKTLQYSTSHFGQPMDKATALYTMTLPFFLLLLSERKSLFNSLLLTSTVMYLLHPMLAATVAFISAITTVLLYRIFGRKIISILFASSILLYLFMPQIMSILLQRDLLLTNLQSLPVSWIDRVDMWQNSVQLISQKPILGWGLNTSDIIENITNNTETNLIRLHPHNIPLQLHLETGFIGGFLFSAVLLMIYIKIINIKDRDFISALLACYSTFLIFSLISFNAWHTWWLCAIFITVLTIIASYQTRIKTMQQTLSPEIKLQL